MSELAIRNHISYLESAGLVSLSAVQPELEYIFKHSLVQEAAYRSLTRGDRRKLHSAVGNALEHVYAGQAKAPSSVLAEHFYSADEPQRAFQYSLLAGDEAMQRFANDEAIRYYQRALKNLPHDVDRSALVQLCTCLGRAYELTGRYPEATRHYEEMTQQARQQGDEHLELAALAAQSVIHSAPTSVNDPLKAEELSTRALELARKLEDRPAESKVLWGQMLAGFFKGRIEEGHKKGLQSLEIARSLGLREQEAYTLNDLAGYSLASQEDLRESLRALEEAKTIWQEIGNLPMLTDSLGQIAFIQLTLGNYRKALATALEGNQISLSIGHWWGQAYNRGIAGFAYAFLGDYCNGLKSIQESYPLSKMAGFSGGMAIYSSLESLIYRELGDLEKALAAAQDSLQISETSTGFWLPDAIGALASVYVAQGRTEEAWSLIQRASDPQVKAEGGSIHSHFLPAAIADLYLALGNYEEAEIAAQEYVKILRHIHAKGFLPDALYAHGRTLRVLGQAVEARTRFEEAKRIARQTGSRRILWRVDALLADLEFEEGNQEKGLAYLRTARKTAQTIADLITDPKFKASFLRQPEVQALLLRVG